MRLSRLLSLAVPAVVAGLLMAPRAACAADADLPRLGRDGDFTLAPPEVTEDAASGWYLRADAGYVAASGGGLSADLSGPVAPPAPTLAATPALPAAALLPAGSLGGGAGWSVGGGLGYRVLPFLRAEVSLDYLALGGADTSLGPVSTSATVALASLYWDVISIAGFTPYVGGGVGFAIDTVDGPAAGTSGRNNWNFAWAVGGGVSYALGGAWSVDLGYRYLDLGAPRLADAGLATTGDLAAHQVRLGLRYMLP